MRTVTRNGWWLISICLIGLVSGQANLWAQDNATSGCKVWPSEPPASSPFQQSKDITGICFTGKYNNFDVGDTWYPSWASNGNMYSPWTDGGVNHVSSLSFVLLPKYKQATTGYATIIGDDPMHLQLTDAGTQVGDPTPYKGRYPAGSLVYNGVWYYGTYGLLDSDGSPDKGLNWDILGPLVGYSYSTDYGKTWHASPHTPANPLFGEPDKPGDPVKMGVPHFVDFGKNMQYSPDGKAYMVAHGAVASDPTPRPANLSWITGDQIYLARVKPSIRNMNDKSKYEFFAGNNKVGHAVWTHDFSKIKPLFEWNNNAGSVTMTYDAPLKKYLMCVTDGTNTISAFNSYILESDQITGPWKMVTYLHHFGEQAYFVHISSKFISSDGRTMWLGYSANFTGGQKSNPPGSAYGLTLQEIKLLP
jgi:hypothetical protein